MIEEDDDQDEVVRVRKQHIVLMDDDVLISISLQTIHKKSEMLFVRGMFFPHFPLELPRLTWPPSAGDSVVLISPQAPS